MLNTPEKLLLEGGLDSALNDDPRPEPAKFDESNQISGCHVCSDPLLVLILVKQNQLREHDLKPWQYQIEACASKRMEERKAL